MKTECVQRQQKNKNHMQLFHVGHEQSFTSQLPNLFIATPKISNFIVLLIVWVRSFSKMLPSIKYAKD